MSFFSRNLNFIVFLYCTYLHGVSGEQSNSHVRNAEQFDNQRRRSQTNPSMPIACRACDKIFFDNVSLVLHFECHHNDESLIPGQHSRSSTSLQGNQNLSSSPSYYSLPFVESTSEVHHVTVPMMGENSRAHCLPGSSTARTNGLPRDASSPRISDVNSIPSLGSSLDARVGLLQAGVRSTMSRRTTSSALSYPPFYSKLVRPSRCPRGLLSRPLHLKEQNKIGNLSNPMIPEIDLNRVAEPYKEVIVISDDEGDSNNGPDEMLDLTLKL